jgi:hypothetical protein
MSWHLQHASCPERDMIKCEDAKTMKKTFLAGNDKEFEKLNNAINGTVCIRHQCRKTTVLSCLRCLINTGVEKINNI